MKVSYLYLNKTNPIIQLLEYTVYFAEISPFIFCLLFIKSIKQNDLKAFLLYTIAMFIFLGLVIYVNIHDSSKNLTTRRIYLVIEFTCIAFYYYYNTALRGKRILLAVSVVSFIAFSIVDYSINKNTKSHFLPLAIECLFFISVIVYFFYEKMKYTVSTPIYTLSSFWISVAFLLYFSGSFFVFVSSISMIDVPGFKIKYRIIYGSVAIIKNILLCVGIFVNKNNKISQKSEAIQPDVNLETFNPFTTPT